MEPDRLLPDGDAPSEDERAKRDPGVRPRPAGWAMGLPMLALLAAVAVMRVSPAIEINIRREAAKLARGETESPMAASGGRVVVAGRDVRIVTDAELPEDVREPTIRRAAAIPAVRIVGTEVTGYVVLSPFAFKVKRSETGIELSGGVPDADLRERLVAQAGRFVPSDQVEDRLRLAAGAPEGFAAAAMHLLATLGPIDPAEGTLTDRRLQASGAPGDAPTYNAVMAALGALPKGYLLGESTILPPRIAPFVWTARRDDGGLSLGGAVPSEEKRAALMRLAGETLPGLPVRDAMQTARGLDRSIDFLDTVRSAFEALGRLKSGEAQIADRRFTLSGETVARASVETIERRLRETLPGAIGAPMVKLVVVPASPFVFSAKRAGGRIELAGYVSDERERSLLASIVGSRFPGERLLDRLIVADGAPPAFAEALKTGLETLSDFAEGEAAIRDRELRYSGRVLYGQLAARLRRTAPRQVPEGWQGRIELDPVRPANALDAYLCADLLGDAARRNPIRFVPGQAHPDPKAAAALEAAADVVRRCGHVGIRVVHHVGGETEAARALSASRARAVVTALSERGATARFSVESAPGQASDRETERLEFHVTPL